MVAGKMKSAMGLRRSSANPKPDSSKKKPVPSPSTPKVPQKVAALSHPIGVYFPRASTQVQPRPPNVAELVRLVEVLRARESLLKTQLLEQKLLKESTAILPRLEKEISSRDLEIERSKKKIECLEAENDRLRQELEVFHVKVSEEKSENEKKLKAMETEVSELKKAMAERNRVGSKGLWSNEVVSEGTDDLQSSRGFQEFIDVSVRSSLIKNLKIAAKLCDIGPTDESRNRNEAVELKRDEAVEAEGPRQAPYSSQEFAVTSQSVITARSRLPRVPKPPPRRSPSSPSTASSSSVSSSHGLLAVAEERSSAERSPIPPPPPAPPSKAAPPPPPPLPAKGLKGTSARVRRVPEVVEFYQSLMRRDSRRDSIVGASESQTSSAPANARDMIGEIENRSAHLHAIKTDVETQGDFIRFLIKEVENAAFTHIDDVVPFVKWLDDELSHLVDERAVLKHFNWPEQKADALREAAFGYDDVKKLESQALTFRENAGQPCASALRKMQALLEKLERAVYNLSRMRESAAKRYKLFQIPVDWMLDSGCATQIKLASVKLAMKYMNRVSAELEIVGSGPEEEELIVQGVRFAFRVHQFAGGFDVETMKAFQELRDKARSCRTQCQNQQQQKFVCRSVAW